MAHLQSQARDATQTDPANDWMEVLTELTPAGVAVFSFRLLHMADGFHFEVELDGLNDPRGSVTLADCEGFSQRFCERIDREIEARALAAAPDDDATEPGTPGATAASPAWLRLLPAEMTIDNYSVEVASAGAERELRLPEELQRFQGLPLKLKWRDAEGGDRVELAVFEGVDRSGAAGGAVADGAPGAGEAGEELLFRRYSPQGGKSRRSLKRQGKRPPSRKDEPQYRLRPEELVQANLYLDF